MATWRIPVHWEMEAVIEVEAPDLESAMEVARDDDNYIPLPEDAYYAEDSWALVYEDTEEVRELYNDNRQDEQV